MPSVMGRTRQESTHEYEEGVNIFLHIRDLLGVLETNKVSQPSPPGAVRFNYDSLDFIVRLGILVLFTMIILERQKKSLKHGRCVLAFVVVFDVNNSNRLHISSYCSGLRYSVSPEHSVITLVLHFYMRSSGLG